MDFREFMLLHDRVLRLRWQQEASLAFVTSAIYRCGFIRFDDPPKPSAFMFTTLPEDKSEAKPRPQTRELVASIFRALAARPKNAG